MFIHRILRPLTSIKGHRCYWMCKHKNAHLTGFIIRYNIITHILKRIKLLRFVRLPFFYITAIVRGNI